MLHAKQFFHFLNSLLVFVERLQLLVLRDVLGFWHWRFPLRQFLSIVVLLGSIFHEVPVFEIVINAPLRLLLLSSTVYAGGSASLASFINAFRLYQFLAWLSRSHILILGYIDALFLSYRAITEIAVVFHCPLLPERVLEPLVVKFSHHF